MCTDYIPLIEIEPITYTTIRSLSIRQIRSIRDRGRYNSLSRQSHPIRKSSWAADRQK